MIGEHDIAADGDAMHRFDGGSLIFLDEEIGAWHAFLLPQILRSNDRRYYKQRFPDRPIFFLVIRQGNPSAPSNSCARKARPKSWPPSSQRRLARSKRRPNACA